MSNLKLTAEEFDRACSLLSAEKMWGEHLTPEVVLHIAGAATAEANARIAELSLGLERTREERNRSQIEARREIHKEHRDYIAKLEAQIAAVAPAVDAQQVGVAGAMPGTDGFTMAVFKADDVPIGTALYASAQSEGLRKDAERWRYAVKHWLDEHIATRQADEAIAALSQHKAGEKDD